MKLFVFTEPNIGDPGSRILMRGSSELDSERRERESGVSGVQPGKPYFEIILIPGVKEERHGTLMLKL